MDVTLHDKFIRFLKFRIAETERYKNHTNASNKLVAIRRLKVRKCAKAVEKAKIRTIATPKPVNQSSLKWHA